MFERERQMSYARTFRETGLRVVTSQHRRTPRPHDHPAGRTRSAQSVDPPILSAVEPDRQVSRSRRPSAAVRSAIIIFKSLLIVSIAMPLGILALMLCVLSIEWVIFDEVKMQFLM